MWLWIPLSISRKYISIRLFGYYICMGFPFMLQSRKQMILREVFNESLLSKNRYFSQGRILFYFWLEDICFAVLCWFLPTTQINHIPSLWSCSPLSQSGENFIYWWLQDALGPLNKFSFDFHDCIYCLGQVVALKGKWCSAIEKHWRLNDPYICSIKDQCTYDLNFDGDKIVKFFPLCIERLTNL